MVVMSEVSFGTFMEVMAKRNQVFYEKVIVELCGLQHQADFDDYSLHNSVIINMASAGAMRTTDEDDSDMTSLGAIRGCAKGSLSVRGDDSPTRELPEARSKI